MSKPNASSVDPRKVLGVLAFSVIAVQLVAGGPWGLEESVREAGPGPVLAAMILLPLLFALPQALMTAELASLCVRGGGSSSSGGGGGGGGGAWRLPVPLSPPALAHLFLRCCAGSRAPPTPPHPPLRARQV